MTIVKYIVSWDFYFLSGEVEQGSSGFVLCCQIGLCSYLRENVHIDKYSAYNDIKMSMKIYTC